MTSRLLLLALVPISLGTLDVGRTASERAASERPVLVRLPETMVVPSLMTCSTSLSQISPCTATATKNVNTSNTYSYSVTNKNQHEAQTFGLTCAVSGSVSSCLIPAPIIVNANVSKSFILSYATGATAGIGGIGVTAAGDFDQVMPRSR